MDMRVDAKARDDLVREALVEALPGAKRIALYLLRNTHAAEDAVQEAAMQAWDKRQSLRDLSAVDAWFGKIVVNACRCELRRRARRPNLTEIQADEDRRNQIELVDQIGRVLARLDPDDQIVLGLRYGRDLTVPQIAGLTGIREGTIKSRLHAAHRQIRAILEADQRLEED